MSTVHESGAHTFYISGELLIVHLAIYICTYSMGHLFIVETNLVCDGSCIVLYAWVWLTFLSKQFLGFAICNINICINIYMYRKMGPDYNIPILATCINVCNVLHQFRFGIRLSSIRLIKVSCVVLVHTEFNYNELNSCQFPIRSAKYVVWQI